MDTCAGLVGGLGRSGVSKSIADTPQTRVDGPDLAAYSTSLQNKGGEGDEGGVAQVRALPRQ